MLNRYARISVERWYGLDSDPDPNKGCRGTTEIVIHRYGRRWGNNHNGMSQAQKDEIGYDPKCGEFGVSRSSINRVLELIKRYGFIAVLDPEHIADEQVEVYEWQPPTLHLIPYQCSICNEIVWSTNDALYIRHYCESVEELLEMVRKS